MRIFKLAKAASTQSRCGHIRDISWAKGSIVNSVLVNEAQLTQVTVRVGPINYVHRWWLIDMTMLSQHRYPLPQSTASQQRVWKEKMTEPLKGINTRWEENIYIFFFSVLSLGNYTVYKIAGMRELSLSRFAILCTLFILLSGSAYHTFYKIRCLSVVLRICKSFVILSYLSLLCLCGKWNLKLCNVTGIR